MFPVNTSLLPGLTPAKKAGGSSRFENSSTNHPSTPFGRLCSFRLASGWYSSAIAWPLAKTTSAREISFLADSCLNSRPSPATAMGLPYPRRGPIPTTKRAVPPAGGSQQASGFEMRKPFIQPTVEQFIGVRAPVAPDEEPGIVRRRKPGTPVKPFLQFFHPGNLEIFADPALPLGETPERPVRPALAVTPQSR